MSHLARLGFETDDPGVRARHNAFLRHTARSARDCRDVAAWAESLKEANREKGVYDSVYFETMADRCVAACCHAASLTFAARAGRKVRESVEKLFKKGVTRAE